MQLKEGKEKGRNLHSMLIGKPLGKWSLTTKRRKFEEVINILIMKVS
jgi:hypothetical protein